jgi:hypothetical protein
MATMRAWHTSTPIIPPQLDFAKALSGHPTALTDGADDVALADRDLAATVAASTVLPLAVRAVDGLPVLVVGVFVIPERVIVPVVIA